MLYLLEMSVIFAVAMMALNLLPMFLFGVFEWDDIRSALLHYAYRSFTFDGDVIPGVRPSLGTRLVIRVLSYEDEAKRALVAKAMAATEPGTRPRRRPVRLSLRLSSRTGRGAAISGALVQAQRSPRPPLGAQFRAR